MRTTVDLPGDLLQQVKNIAADKRTSISKVIAELVGAAISPPGPAERRVSTDPTTGFKSISFGRIVTTEDVRAALDDE